MGLDATYAETLTVACMRKSADFCHNATICCVLRKMACTYLILVCTYVHTCVHVCMYMRMCVHAYVCTCVCEHPGEELESCSVENGIMAWHTFKV